MSTALLILESLWATMVVCSTLFLLVAALRYARASAAERVLIAPAPEGDNIIQLRNYRLADKGLKLSVQAHHNPSRGGNNA